ncbi:hypothetical protein [Flocculibacter collagenilyticus]|uniref:hypothetical protein n=1 Tax=Flocculibacter collagenilyticus TaxID=2744479 RepID=UPI0018F481E6|nr:hypothetical protein [Flocculibacter collagenilyticus]
MVRCNVAYAFLQALPSGVVSLEDIVKWADTAIVEEDEPCIEIIELSAAQKESEALLQLKILSAGYDEEKAMKLFFDLCYEALKNGVANYSTVARRLFFWSAYETSLEGYSGFVSFWDSLDLAYDCVYGNPEEIEREMLAYLGEKKA